MACFESPLKSYAAINVAVMSRMFGQQVTVINLKPLSFLEILLGANVSVFPQSVDQQGPTSKRRRTGVDC